jgi:predicted transcriptional regulator
MMPSVISFRIDETKRDKLDLIADGQKRDRSFIINEAIDNYLDVYNWQIEHIKKGLKQADNGEFATEDDVKKTFASFK